MSSFLAPLNREGYPFVAGFAVVTAVLFLFSTVLGWAGLVLTLWCAYFFRDPERFTPTREGLIVSPADGKVIEVATAAPPPELDMGPEPRPRVCIFMNVASST